MTDNTPGVTGYLRKDLDRVEAQLTSLQNRLDATYVRLDRYMDNQAVIKDDIADIKGRAIWLFRAVVTMALGVVANLIVLVILRG